jgi:hypothetical protein
MKRKFDIRLATEKEDLVAYEGANHAKRYMRKLVAQMPLDTDKWEKLTDFACHRTHLTRFCIDVVEERVWFNAGSPMTLKSVTNYVWQCYVVAHRRSNLLRGDGIEEAVRAMWTLFLLMFQYTRRGTSMHLDQSAARFAFCEYAESQSAQICVSATCVGDYSVHTHWQASTAMVPILYDFAYSPAMYDYVQALLCRHAQIVMGIDSPASINDAMHSDHRSLVNNDEEDENEVYDSPLYCSRTVGRLFYVDPNNTRRVLNDMYIAHAEILFGPQMVRINRVRWLSERATLDHVIFDMSLPSLVATQGLVSFMERLSSDDVLRRFVVDPMREQVLRTHLMHGERARFVRLHPKQEPEADNILATLRHNDYSETPALLVTPLGEIARGYRDSLKTAHVIGAWASRPRLTYEREFLLGAVVTIGTWMTYQGAPSDFVTKRIHLEEMHVGLDELASPLVLPELRPALVRCMRWHFVFNINEHIVYAGINPIAAIGAWLRCVRDEAVDRLKLDSTVIHEMLHPLMGGGSPASSAKATTLRSNTVGAGVSFVKL